MVDCVCEELQCQYDDQQRGLMEGHRRRVERAPKGIEFRVSHRKARTFKCAKLDSRTPLTFMFENDKGGQSSIKDYFQVGLLCAPTVLARYVKGLGVQSDGGRAMRVALSCEKPLRSHKMSRSSSHAQHSPLPLPIV